MFGLPLAFAAPAVARRAGALAALYSSCASRRRARARSCFRRCGCCSASTARSDAGQDALAAAAAAASRSPRWSSWRWPGRSGTRWPAGGAGPLLVVVDDGWAAAPTLGSGVAARARARSGGRRAAGRLVALAPISQGGQEVTAARRRRSRGAACARWRPVPYAPDREAALAADRAVSSPPTRGGDRCGSPTASNSAAASAFAARLADADRGFDRGRARRRRARAIAGADNLAGALAGASDARRRDGAAERAWCARSTRRAGAIGEAPFDFGAALATEAQLRTAGRTAQRDRPPRRRRRALGRRDLAGRRALAPAPGRDRSPAPAPTSPQPLLSPTYYIRRALAPFADIREAARGGERSDRCRCSPRSPRCWRSPT